MTSLKFPALATSLVVNLVFAVVFLSGGDAVQPRTSVAMSPADDSARRDAVVSHAGVGVGTLAAGGGNHASPATVWVPVDDLARLVQTEGDELLFGGKFSELFDLPEDSAARMTDLSRVWISEIKKMESAGISLVNEGHESFYIIRANQDAYTALLDRIQRDISGVPGVRDPAMIFRLVSNAPWIGSLREPYELNFTRGKYGEYYFTAPRMTFMVSQESGNMLDLAKTRYGHLFDFDPIAAKTPPKAR